MRTFLLCVVLQTGLYCFAQSSAKDSLLRVLATTEEDTTRINVLLKAGEFYLDKDNDSCLYYNRAAEQLINKLHAENFRHRCYHNLVKVYHAKFDHAKALDYCLKAIETAKKNNNVFQQALSYRAVFNLYHNVHQNDSAVKYSVLALNLTEKIGDTEAIATNYGNLCRLYNDLGQFNKAIEFGKKGIEAGEKYKDTKGMLISINNLGNSYLQLDDNKNAIPLFEKLLALGQQFGRVRSVQNALINLGVIYFGEANKAGVQKVVLKFKETENDVDENDLSVAAWRHIISAYDYMLKFEFHPAEKELLIVKKMATDSLEIGDNAIESLYLTLAKLKFAEGDFLEGNRYDGIWDSLNYAAHQQELSTYALDLETKYETEAKEAKIFLQESQLKQKTLLNYSLIAAIVLVLIIGFLGYRTYRQKQKLQQQRIGELETEKQLTATEAVLKGEEQERTRLAKDLHDGLGGMLSGIKYAFQTMKGNLIMTPENQQAFERSMDMLDSSIKEMRRVAHNMMPETLVKFGLDTALSDFCNDINQSAVLKLGYQSSGLEQVAIDQTTAITIYRVVQELVNNIIKHATAKSAIVQAEQADGIVTITVEDDGKGFDPVILQQSKGIGWSNIQSRVEFLKGKLDVKSTAGKGTSVLIELKL